MLWLPATQTPRFKRRRWRRLARLFLFLFLLFGLGAAAVPPEQALSIHTAEITAPYVFDFVNWETHALSGELRRRWSRPPLPSSEADQRALVETFLALEQQARDLQQALDAIYASETEPDRPAKRLQDELVRVKAAQAEMVAQVETILILQVEVILREEGFTWQGYVFTPPAFRFIEPPTGLIISPRDRIDNELFVQLQPGLDNGVRVSIEDALDQRGDVSSYVTNIGGLGSYPTMVVTYPALPWVVEVIAHEWVHNYFFSFPSNMAWGYQTYPHLRTINETTADLVGKEIGRKVIMRFYPDHADELPPLDETGQPPPAEPSEFDLAMRRIRLDVDDLLAQGRIEEAEAYMEAERLKLVAQGHNLRKLNQAYFAFHGAYALSPASVDPTGQQLRALRAQSPSLKDFVDRVGRLNSYENFLAWLAEAGVEIGSN